MPDKKKINVLLVSTKSVWGGAQKYVYDIATNLSPDEFNVTIAAGGNGSLANKLRDKGFKYVEIPALDRDVDWKNDVKAFFQILQLVRTVKPNVVHLNGSKVGTMGVFAAKLALVGTKVIYSTHGIPLGEERPEWQRKLIWRIMRLSGSFLDTMIAISRADYQLALKERLINTKRLVFIPISIRADAYKFLTKRDARGVIAGRLHLPKTHFDQKFIVGSLAEFTKNKGLSYAISGIKRFFDLSPADKGSTILVLIGWGELKNELNTLIEENALDKKVYIVESQETDAQLLKAFDLFILPSIKEGLPYTLLEAAMAKVPMIASRVGGSPEVVRDHETGILVSPRSPDEIANAILLMSRDRELVQNFTKQAHAHVLRSFALYSMMKTTEQLYRELTRNNG